MRDIAREFYRAHKAVPIRFLIVTVICEAVLWISGTFARENTRIPAIAVSAFLVIITLWALFDVLTAPKRFERRLEQMPENIGEEIRTGFSGAHKLGERWFLDNYLIYFVKRRIQILRFDEIRSADLKGNKLYMSLADGKSTPLPFGADENPAILVAALRSRNGQITASIDGKPVNFNKKRNAK